MDEIELLRTALHALDKRLTETDAWARGGVENNAGNLQRVVDGLKDTRDQLYNSSNGKPGIISIVNTWWYETIPAIKARQEAQERELDALKEFVEKRRIEHDKQHTWQTRQMIIAALSLIGGLVLVLVKK